MNVKSYMADIDREIVLHRQEIAKRRLRISELEDMRVLMMQREEYRATMDGEVSPFGTLHDAVIAVRENRTMLEDGALSHAAKTGTLPPTTAAERKRLREQTPERLAYKRDYNRRKYLETHPGGAPARAKRNDAGKPRTSGPHRKYLDQVERLLKANPKSQFNIDAIIDRLGIGPLHGEERQPLYQALYEMKKQGVITKPQTGVYQLAAKEEIPA